MKWLNTRDADFESGFSSLIQDRQTETGRVDAPVAEILAKVRAEGDAALCDYTARFDHLELNADRLRISDEEISAACEEVSSELIDAIDVAARRIEAFHRAQMPKDLCFTDADGLTLGQRWTSLDAVGLYVPGGKAAYPSSVLMNAIPARVAGVARLAMCVPTPGGVLNPLVLAAARRAGVREIYRVGGAQAVGAMAFGTESIAPVDRIVGPGNAWVAEAKRQVFGHVGIDSIAGPSEVVVLADAKNSPRLVALDLLAQAEHDELAQSVLITDDAAFGERVVAAVEQALTELSRAAIAGASWRDHGAVIVVENWAQAAQLVDRIAPEHLEIMLDDAENVFAQVKHAGAAFLGRYCPEAVGDYVGGPNHVLPTSRTARFASGLSVYDFLKRTTFIATDESGLKKVGPAGVAIAHAEGLEAHALSISERLDSLAAKEA